MSELRFAILGLGRSGLAIARACHEKQWQATVYDESPAGGLHKPELLDALHSIGIEAKLAWTQQIDEGSYDVLVVNPAIPRDHARILDALAANKRVWGEIEFAYRISKAPIVALTGTNGKSTTTVMTYLALTGCGFDAKLCGNIYGSGFGEAPLTEHALSSTSDQILVAEISSFQLEWIEEFRPISAGITNITPDHLPRYDNSFDDYAATKMRIFSALTPAEFAIVRANDPVVIPPGKLKTSRRGKPSPKVDAPRILTFGATSDDARVETDRLVVFGEVINHGALNFEEEINLTNSAMAMMLAYGALVNLAEQGNERAAELVRKAIDDRTAKLSKKRSVYAQPVKVERALPHEIIQALTDFPGLAHRMERVGKRGGIEVINNSMCTNPDAVLRSTMGLRGVVHLLMGGVNKDLDFKPLRGYLQGHMHRVYLFGRDGPSLNSMLGGTHGVFDTMEEAFRASTAVVKPGETIMLAPGCASSDQFRDFVDRGNVFRAIAKEWLSNESSMEAR